MPTEIKTTALMKKSSPLRSLKTILKKIRPMPTIDTTRNCGSRMIILIKKSTKHSITQSNDKTVLSKLQNKKNPIEVKSG